MTQYSPNEAESADAVDFYQAKRGIGSWLFTLDHKRIGLLYLFAILASFLLGTLLAILVRVQLVAPGQSVVTPDTFTRLFTLHGAVMVFLVLMPSIPASLGNFVLPLLLGAKNVAYPRLNLLGFYLYLAGAVLGVLSMVDGAADPTWTFYTVNAARTNPTIILMVVSAFVLALAAFVNGFNVLATIHQQRAPGMTFFRLPLFAWSLYATALVQVFAMPVIALMLAAWGAERALDVRIFDPSLGGDPVLFQHLSWLYSSPVMYIMIIPALGVVSELFATFARKPVFGYRSVVLAMLSLAIVGFLAWDVHMFSSQQSLLGGMLFSYLVFLAAVPAGVAACHWIATLYQADIHLDTPMWYALSFLFLFIVGGLSGLFLGALSTDAHLHDTYFAVGHFHYLALGGIMTAFFGGLYYWWPKITGRVYSEALGKLGCLLLFVGINATFLVHLLMGAQGVLRRSYTYAADFQPLQVVATVGTATVALGFLIVAYSLLTALRGDKAPANPWSGTTLEWQTESPPRADNFLRAPQVSAGPYHRA